MSAGQSTVLLLVGGPSERRVDFMERALQQFRARGFLTDASAVSHGAISLRAALDGQELTLVCHRGEPSPEHLASLLAGATHVVMFGHEQPVGLDSTRPVFHTPDDLAVEALLAWVEETESP